MKEKKSASGWRNLFQSYNFLSSSVFKVSHLGKGFAENTGIIFFTLHIKLFQLKTYISQYFYIGSSILFCCGSCPSQDFVFGV